LIEKLGVSLVPLAARLASIVIIINAIASTTPAPIYCVWVFIAVEILFNPHIWMCWTN
jgi:hypothetical protein